METKPRSRARWKIFQIFSAPSKTLSKKSKLGQGREKLDTHPPPSPNLCIVLEMHWLDKSYGGFSSVAGKKRYHLVRTSWESSDQQLVLSPSG